MTISYMQYTLVIYYEVIKKISRQILVGKYAILEALDHIKIQLN